MDFGIITGIAGALGIGTVIGNLVSSYRARRDKREERGAARDEAHRDQLRHAYSEFISTYGKFLDQAELLYSINKAIDEMPVDAFAAAVEAGCSEAEANARAARAVTPEIRARARQNLDDFANASAEANTKAVALLLIDDDVTRRGLVLPLSNAHLNAPQAENDFDRYRDDVAKLRRQLKELSVSLAGAFSPDRWHAEVAERRALTAKAPKRITAGTR